MSSISTTNDESKNRPAASVTSTELDLTNSKRGVWLVKVPKYISQRWENAREQTEVGKLLISKGTDGAPEIKFTLSDELIKVPVSKANESNKNPTSSTTNKSTALSNAKKPQSSTADSQFIALPKPVKPQVKNSLIGTKQEIVFNQKDLEIPKEHKFAISDVTHQHLAVFSEQYDEQSKNKRLILEGNVVQKGNTD